MTGPGTSTRLILVRHGEAHCNVDNIVAGERTCVGLTDQGREQSECLAKYIGEQGNRRPISTIYSSTAPRAVQTAKIIGQTIKRPVFAAFPAPIYGEAEGKPWSEVVAALGGTPALSPHVPIAAGAESWIVFAQRTAHELNEVVQQHPNETVLVVAHHETVIAAAQSFLGLVPWSRADITFRMGYTAQTVWQKERLSWSDPEDDYWRWTLVRHNDTRHLTTMLPRRESQVASWD
ncbi:histidine phosphatase family protein [Nocardia terpenica]|uniref:Histidine phosphatase family protein n=1 Tax=Nocardia terpenica TaxID=455432 RepID=A0A6G9YZB3_9NOCA|nr:histidine phosphatase family protein [Nocardia terpenica]QIS18554.1 histidine phosphatase family protein [Nocardia terpenica]